MIPGRFSNLRAWLFVSAALVLAIGVGCAPHARSMAPVLAALRAAQLQDALAQFDQRGGNPDDLLFQLERGHLLHLAGRWAESNQAFERAEEIADALYTRSLTREAVALATTDLELPYRGMPYELQLVQYYRALNYLALEEWDEALVEARKANFELEQYADGKDDGALRQDAFLHYVTGLLYRAEGEWNDAIVAFRDAHSIYDRYREEYGVPPPASLVRDYVGAARRVGLDEEVRELTSHLEPLDRAADGVSADGASANVVLFVESGFVPPRESVDLTLPIYEDGADDDPWRVAGRYRDRYGREIYDYPASRRDLSHVLRFAFPRLAASESSVSSVRVVDVGGREREGELGLDLARVARAEFDARLPNILLRTVARAIVKEAARKKAEGKSEALGAVINLLGAASEQADTRGWILLPARIDLVQLALPPGRHSLEVRLLGSGDRLVESRPVEIDVPEQGTRFAAVRSFR